MIARTLPAGCFVRKTQLGRDEYRKNFRQFDSEIIAAVTSPDADVVTPLMSKVYLRLGNAPAGCWEREGVLRFAGEESNAGWVTAWEQLVLLVGVASATARKALVWMHEQGIIGYFAGKNGVGIRIFLNRAASSIGQRPLPGQKNLRLVHTSTDEARTSAGDMPFKDSYADLETLETDITPRAPENGAESNGEINRSSAPSTQTHPASRVVSVPAPPAEEMVERMLRKFGTSVESAAMRAAAREHERTREWLENRGLPKAARVAQREAYNVLRQRGLISTTASRSGTGSVVGRDESAPAQARALASDEVRELAEMCNAMLEVHGQAVDVTLAGLRAEAGGTLLAEDEPKVRDLAEAIAFRGGRL
jgi:hypothetical protein